MAKVAKSHCTRCDSRLLAGDRFCESCGHPTSWASHEDRVAWEVRQYREKTIRQPIRSPLEHSPRPARSNAAVMLADAEEPEPAKRRLGVFSRRRATPQTIVLPETKRTEPPVVSEPEDTPSPVLTVVRAGPAPEPTLEPSPSDHEPAADTPATVLAMRLLNARVAELDARLRQVQEELATLHDKPRRRPRR